MAYTNVNVGSPDRGDGANAVAVNDSTRALLVDLAAGAVTFPSTVTISGLVTLGASTASVGNVALEAGTAVIGHVIADASTASIGHVTVDNDIALAGSTEVVGHVVVDSGAVALAASTESIGIVSVTPTASLLGVASVTPTTVSLVLPTTDGLSVTIPAATAKVSICAKAGTTEAIAVYFNYNAAATTASPTVPESQFTIDCNAADAAKIQLLGNSADMVTIVFQG